MSTNIREKQNHRNDRKKGAAGNRPPLDRPNHPSHLYIGARDYDPMIDVPDFDPGGEDREQPWVQVIDPTEPGRPRIFVRRPSSGAGFEALFALELGSVADSPFGSSAGKPPVPHKDLVRDRYFRSLFSRLKRDQWICFVHNGGRDRMGDVVFSSRIVAGSASASLTKAAKSAQSLFDDIMLAFAADAESYRYVPADAPPWIDPGLGPWRASVRPVAIEIDEESPHHSIGYVTQEPGELLSISVRVDVPVGAGSIEPASQIEERRRNRPGVLDSLLVAAAGCPAPFEVRLRITPIRLTEDEICSAATIQKLILDRDRRSFRYEPSEQSLGALSPHTLDLLHSRIERWMSRPQGYRVACSVYSSAHIPEPFLEILGQELFDGCPITCEQVSLAESEEAERPVPSLSLNLRCAFNATDDVPPLFPATSGLTAIGMRRHFRNPHVDLPDDGIVLGELTDTPMPVDVRVGETDRSRHCYLIGATGTGKSTLLYNLIVQDIAAGRGVGLLDPHGDLFQQVLGAIPRRRIKDVVLVDPTDFEHAVSINFLECFGPHVWKERNFIINELYLIFDRLYDMQSAGGPIFEQYMRGGLGLLMEDPMQNATLADIPRVFEDESYRKYLKDHCRDPLLKSFWTDTAEKAGGDSSLRNMAPYITSKFNQFTHNRLIRPIIGQVKSTIDFRRIMDSGQILLVNLSKGHLGEKDTAFLGMIVVGKLMAAALSRANVEAAKRKRFYLYIDEFQNFTTDTVASMLAEARKFGLCLTLAHQNMSQLPESLLDSVMGNVGTKLFFRIGTSDAPVIENYVKPNLTATDLLTLPDQHVAGRLLANNIPTPPFVFRTHAPRFTNAAMARAIAADAIAQSRAHHTRPVSEIETEIAERRSAYMKSIHMR